MNNGELIKDNSSIFGIVDYDIVEGDYNKGKVVSNRETALNGEYLIASSAKKECTNNYVAGSEHIINNISSTTTAMEKMGNLFFIVNGHYVGVVARNGVIVEEFKNAVSGTINNTCLLSNGNVCVFTNTPISFSIFNPNANTVLSQTTISNKALDVLYTGLEQGRTRSLVCRDIGDNKILFIYCTQATVDRVYIRSCYYSIYDYSGNVVVGETPLPSLENASIGLFCLEVLSDGNFLFLYSSANGDLGGGATIFNSDMTVSTIQPTNLINYGNMNDINLIKLKDGTFFVTFSTDSSSTTTWFRYSTDGKNVLNRGGNGTHGGTFYEISVTELFNGKIMISGSYNINLRYLSYYIVSKECDIVVGRGGVPVGSISDLHAKYRLFNPQIGLSKKCVVFCFYTRMFNTSKSCTMLLKG